jgi:hypothetical protein
MSAIMGTSGQFGSAVGENLLPQNPVGLIQCEGYLFTA